MAHIHLPDGAFSVQFLIFWWILAAVLITTALLLARRADHHRRAVGITVMVAAASFAIFQVNLPFAGGDLADCSAHTERVIQ